MIIDEIFAGFMAQWDTCLNVVRLAGPGLPSADVCLELQRRLRDEHTRRLAAQGVSPEIRAPFYAPSAVKDPATLEACRSA